MHLYTKVAFYCSFRACTFLYLCSFDSLRVHGGDAWEGNNIIPAIENVELSSAMVLLTSVYKKCLEFLY